jgi:hypothetical protein
VWVGRWRTGERSTDSEREREEQESITVICLISLSGSLPLTVVTSDPAPEPPPLGRRDDLAETLLLRVTKSGGCGSGGEDSQGALRCYVEGETMNIHHHDTLHQSPSARERRSAKMRRREKRRIETTAPPSGFPVAERSRGHGAPGRILPKACHFPRRLRSTLQDPGVRRCSCHRCSLRRGVERHAQVGAQR